jgi:integrase
VELVAPGNGLRGEPHSPRSLLTHGVATPLGATPYTLRHACVSTWLNGGVPPTQVPEWAGHSVDVLLKVYAKCPDGQDALARRRVFDALGYRDT